jgi:hypothetical protein
MKQELSQKSTPSLFEMGYLDENNQVSQRFSHIEDDLDWEKDCERVKNLDKLLYKLLGKKASEDFRNGCNQILDEIAMYHNFKPGCETGDKLRHIYLILAEEKIDSVLRQDYSYHPKVGQTRDTASKKPIRDLVAIADSSLYSIERKSQSIEEWAQDLVIAYRSGPNRPDNLVVLLQRYGECYFGSVYVQKDKGVEDGKTKRD